MNNSFLQTPDWEDFQKAAGYETTRINGKLLIKHKNALGHYWYSPRPTLNEKDLEEFKDFATSDKAIFAQVDPQNSIKHKNPEAKSAQPQNSLVLELEDPTDLIKKFHSKTRYNIRLAEKKELSVIEYTADFKGVEAFLRLSGKTAQRQQIKFSKDNYYRKMIEALGGMPEEGKVKVSIFVAYLVRIPVAVNIMLWHSDEKIAYYLHGASDHKYRKVMAPHLLQWKAMQAAYDRGFQKYDFWGIAPLEDGKPPEGHPWAGITRFKLGFGGQVVTFPNSFEIITRPAQYKMLKLATTVKRRLRF